MAGITGRQQRRQSVFNGFLPDDNQPYIVPVDYDFGTVGVISEDFTVGQMDKILPFVQTCFIDNGLNANPLTIHFPIADYTLRVPSLGQGVFPVYMPMPFLATLSTTAADGLKIKINWCNFQQPYGQWIAV